MVGLSLALAHLRAGDPAAAAELFAGVAARWNVLEAWTGLAASALRLGDPGKAAASLHAGLSQHAVSLQVRVLAAAVAARAGYPGWCAVDTAGWLHVDAPAELRLDGVEVVPLWRGGRWRVPPGSRLEVSRAGRALLGSPVDLTAIAACEGFVSLSERGDLTGWAWHPGNPAKAPSVRVSGRVIPLRRLARVPLDRPMARPRAIHVPAAELPGGSIEVLGSDGRALLGSPLQLDSAPPSPVMPGLDPGGAAKRFRGHGPWNGCGGTHAVRLAVWNARSYHSKSPAAGRRRSDAVDGRIKSGHDGGNAVAKHDLPVPDVVVPVYRGLAVTLACLRAVLATLPSGSRLHVVNDASPDPALTDAVAALAADKRVNLIQLAHNHGFPGAANAGLRAAAGRDVALLNSDALVPPGWLPALQAAAHSAPDIASACPLSNEATILSYPIASGGNPPAEPGALAALARLANGAATVDIPVGVGFCMLMRRDCIEQVGLFREDVFAQGYGEENDWCLRARQRGWRHVAAPGCYVAHEGAASFGTARRHLLERNGALLERLHPGYHQAIEAWVAQDPLGPARRRIDGLRWQAGRQASAVALVTHDSGGGVERVVAARSAAWQRQGVRPVLIRPSGDAALIGDGSTPNLCFRLPAEWPALLRLLRADRVMRVELHHTLGHAPGILELAPRLGVPQEVFVHDYALFCPRIALVAEQAYCGEPDVAACERCVARHGSHLSEPIGPAALVERSAELLRRAAGVVAPSADVARRMRRHFPKLRPQIAPWEDDAAIPPPPQTGPVQHVVVIGGIGLEKGYEVLLGCVADAAARRLPLRFTVVGSTADDERLLAAGPVFITGRYSEDEAEALIRAQLGGVALLPSVWPETWCFTLSQAWRAGLRAVVFDLGTPAERVRRTGWGHVLPLGLPPAALNDWLLRLGRGSKQQTAACKTPSPLPLNPAI